MLCAGVDVGSLWTKAAVFADGELVGKAARQTGEETAVAAEGVLAEALEGTRATRADLAAVIATGAGKNEVDFAAGVANEIMCAAKGAFFVDPQISGVIELGGESTRVAKLDTDGSVLDFARNDKCASGTGIFLDAMAKVMGVTVEEMGPISLESTADIYITSTCVAFAESEVVSQVHRQTPKMDILRGMHRSIATRVFSLVQRLDLDGRNMAVGGLAQNVGVVASLEEMMEKPLAVPEGPHVISAIGAALIAAEGAAEGAA